MTEPIPPRLDGEKPAVPTPDASTPLPVVADQVEISDAANESAMSMVRSTEIPPPREIERLNEVGMFTLTPAANVALQTAREQARAEGANLEAIQAKFITSINDLLQEIVMDAAMSGVDFDKPKDDAERALVAQVDEINAIMLPIYGSLWRGPTSGGPSAAPAPDEAAKPFELALQGAYAELAKVDLQGKPSTDFIQVITFMTTALDEASAAGVDISEKITALKAAIRVQRFQEVETSEALRAMAEAFLDAIPHIHPDNKTRLSRTSQMAKSLWEGNTLPVWHIPRDLKEKEFSAVGQQAAKWREDQGRNGADSQRELVEAANKVDALVEPFKRFRAPVSDSQ